MQTFSETQQKKFLKKFHTLCGKQGIDNEGKKDIIAQYGAGSSRDLSARQLLDICDKLEMSVDPKFAEQDKYRKRLIASIGAWLRAMGKVDNIQVIKAIACRASGVDSFNKIPIEKLRSLYSAFNKKRKDLEMVEELTIEELDYLTTAN